ncbi:toxin-activating lysine-acyltransferase [Salidesulfovibrio onnuriiensis]|uniref:toxin-activating lysine-acyltransferase n=1 Tax=Salidesulfovibrio onnuriiensis TaxID=2583823 RepID=UPI0011CCDC2F|nr:toxin-activating lysine-acyltransferase [Salidesulfovibrio onnuriiensis]
MGTESAAQAEQIVSGVSEKEQNVAEGSNGNEAHAANPGEKLSKSPHEFLFEIFWLLSQSPNHKYMFIADMEWYLMPPFRLRQIKIFHKEGAPVAYACWAKVSDEVDERLRNGSTKLRPEEWNSGENLWLVDLVTPFGGAEFVVNELKEKVFEGRKMKTWQPAPDGNGLVVVEWN